MKILGLDVGGSSIKAAIVDAERGELCSDFLQQETPSGMTPEEFEDVVSRVSRQLDWRGPVGCGFPAVIR